MIRNAILYYLDLLLQKFSVTTKATLNLVNNNDKGNSDNNNDKGATKLV